VTEITWRRLRVRGLEFGALTAGPPDGELVVLLHGFPQTAACWAEVAGEDRFHLVGHDWGGVVARALAGQHPERVITLTSVSTPHPRAFAAALVTSAQLLRSAYIGFFRIPRLPELALGARGLRGLRFLLTRSGLAPEWADRYTRALAEPGAGSPAPTASTSWKGRATGCRSTTLRSWPSWSCITWRTGRRPSDPRPGPAGCWRSWGGAAG
jgi:pimeloyl-ACP methyl ester carboxylesterase